MHLLFLRHGEAVREHGLRDEDRPLTDHGRAQARAVGEALVAARIDPDLVVCSPLLRARQTAELVCAAIGGRTIHENAALVPSADPQDLFAEYASSTASTLLFVGHQPFIGDAVGLLLTGDESLDLTVETATLIGIDIRGVLRTGMGRLELLLPVRYIASHHE